MSLYTFKLLSVRGTSSAILAKTDRILNTQYDQTTENTYELNRVFTEHIQLIANKCLILEQLAKVEYAFICLQLISLQGGR